MTKFKDIEVMGRDPNVGLMDADESLLDMLGRDGLTYGFILSAVPPFEWGQTFRQVYEEAFLTDPSASS